MLALVFAIDVIASVVSVYDGDTLRVDVVDWPEIVGSNMPIRVHGVDAPEIQGKCAKEREAAIAARDYVRTIVDGQTVILVDPKRGKYFRLIADIEVNGLLLSDLLLQSGHARAYDGGPRTSWCD